MHVHSLSVNVMISCYARRKVGGTLFYGLYGEAPTESLREGGVGNKYLYGEATSRGPPYPSRKRSRFVIDSYFMTMHFQQLKGIQISKQGM